MRNRLEQLPQQVKDTASQTKKFFQKLKKRPPKKLDEVTLEIHEEVFATTNCMDCANCCKTTGPLFERKDIGRIAKYLRIKPAQFEANYLRVDEDNDWVLQSVPCPFLAEDNACSIYDVRPKACREFPHTDRPKIHQIAALTQKNIAVCPAAFSIVEKMKERLS
ncbi:YkgJ family cysteine cluster protein [Flavobacteriaceae bacterium]|nr:YkgJ family cysteine cluster protein [Flavobacteriaceae bacterium]MDB4187028.1 YkgJ family cysteine cluster protein [Flavobacteriaceae bacterium]